MAIIEPIEQSPYPEQAAASAMIFPAAEGTTRVVTGIFETRAAASAAVDALIQYGRSRDDISMMMSSGTRTKEFGFETGTHAAESASIGSAVGGAAGAILAAIAAVGTNVVLPRAQAAGVRGASARVHRRTYLASSNGSAVSAPSTNLRSRSRRARSARHRQPRR